LTLDLVNNGILVDVNVASSSNHSGRNRKGRKG
jgi:hypothetical protein